MMLKKNLLVLVIAMAPLYLFAQNGLTGIALPSGFSPFALREMSCAQSDKQGNLWVGFGPGGIGLAKYSGQSWTVYNTINSSLPDMNIICLEVDNDILWVGTGNGLMKIDASGNFTAYNSGNSKLPGDKINALKKHKNDLWIGTESGLCRLTAGDFEAIVSGDLWKEITCLETETNDILWVGTIDGIIKYDNGIKLHMRTGNSALKNNGILAIKRDKNNIIWVGAKTYTALPAASSLYYIKENQLYDATETFCHATRLPEEVIGFAKDAEGNVFCQGQRYWGAGNHFFLYQVRERDFDLYTVPGSVTFSESLRLGTAGPNIVLLIRSMYDSIYLFNPDQYNEPFLPKAGSVKVLDINRTSTALPKTNIAAERFMDIGYQVPKDDCNSAIFTSGLWLGGLDANDSLHCAITTYNMSGRDFLPGTLDTGTGTFDVLGNSQIDFTYTWELRKAEIEAFKEAWSKGEVQNGTYNIPNDILHWPAHGKGNSAKYLAPFVDLNGDDIYNPQDGDYPLIKGDQMIYWIINDNTAPHGESGSKAFGVEIHCSAWAYGCMDIKDSDSNSAVNYTTFYEKRVINRGNKDYKEVFLGTFVDVDLGSYSDDFVGCNPAGNYAFAYDDNNHDAPGGYGKNPPMINVLYLNKSMDKFVSYNNNWSVTGNPQNETHYYNYLRGTFKDGSPLTYGGSGHMTGAPTSWHFSGTPWDTGWTELAGQTPGDRRFLMSSGPHDLKAKEEISLQYAIIYSRDAENPNGLNTSWAKNEQYIRRIKDWYAKDSFPSCPDKSAAIFDENTSKPRLKVYPNPGTHRLYIEMAGAIELEAEVYDGLGRKVLVTILRSAEGTFDLDISHLSHGAYILRTKASGEVAGTVFIKQE